MPTGMSRLLLFPLRFLVYQLVLVATPNIVDAGFVDFLRVNPLIRLRGEGVPFLFHRSLAPVLWVLRWFIGS